MPITTSAKKALRNSAKKRVFNLRRKDAISKSLKQLKKLSIAKDTKGAVAEMRKAQQALDKAVKTGLIKKNTASRKKSRLAKMIKKIG
jgi:small subunit ribosomal protein S20